VKAFSFFFVKHSAFTCCDHYILLFLTKQDLTPGTRIDNIFQQYFCTNNLYIQGLSKNKSIIGAKKKKEVRLKNIIQKLFLMI